MRELKLQSENTIVDIPELNQFRIGDAVIADECADCDRHEGIVIGIELQRIHGSNYLQPSITLLHDGYVTDGFKPMHLRKVETPPPAPISLAPELSSELIAALIAVSDERARQQNVEGWTAEHDDLHKDRSMAVAAACYAMFAAVSDSARSSTDMSAGLTVSGEPIRGWGAWLEIWPWARSWWKPTDRRRDLIKAAALIMAEIARLDRAAAASEGSADGR